MTGRTLDTHRSNLAQVIKDSSSRLSGSEPNFMSLWPIVRAIMAWGDACYSPTGIRRTLRHDRDGGLLDHEGRRQTCGSAVPVPETRIEPGPGFELANHNPDPVSAMLNTPRRLLEPLTTSRTPQADEST
jgi:hypothetical protein